MNLHFYKMQGCGNDFLILDYLSDSDPPEFSRREVIYFCDRHYGIGADGLVQLVSSADAHAKWNFFNCDGSEAEMCGNAARCVIQYLSDKHFQEEELLSIETKVGIIKGKTYPHDRLVEITLMSGNLNRLDVEEIVVKADETVHRVFCVNTGVPHAVIEVQDLKTFPINQVGRALVRHSAFGNAGSNVTFFEKNIGNKINSTTFERGVEEETFACGTGAAAAALVYSQLYLQTFPIDVTVPGGVLTVDFSPVSKILLLRGPAEYCFEVEMTDFPQGFEKPFLFGKGTTK